MEIEDFVRELQAIHWEWMQDAIGEVILERGWERYSGTTYKEGERRTYKGDWGWTWSVYSKAGAVNWQSVTVLRIDSTDRTMRQQVRAEHESLVSRLASVLGLPEYDGTVFDDPKRCSFSANRVTRWQMEEIYLTLSHTDAERDIPAWLSLEIEPLATYRGEDMT